MSDLSIIDINNVPAGDQAELASQVRALLRLQDLPLRRRAFVLGLDSSGDLVNASDAPAYSLGYFGVRATEDGFTSDQSTKLMDALQSGHILDGQGLTYNFAGDLFPDAGSFRGLINAKLRCTARGSTGRNFFLRDQSSFTLDNVHVVGDGQWASTAGDNPAQIWIDFCTNFDAKNIKASHGGPGTGIRVADNSDFNIYSPTAFDMRWELTGQTDDVIDAIMFLNNEHFNVFGTRVFGITGNNFGLHTPDGGHPDTPRYTRGLASGGNQFGSFIGGAVRGVDQGVDTTAAHPGPDFNSGFVSFTGINTHATESYGFKFANVQQDMFLVNCISSYSHSIGFVFIGSGADPAAMTKRITLTNCGAYNPGGSTHISQTRHAGFDIGDNTNNANEPSGVELINCWALDDRAGVNKKMTYGARTEMVPDNINNNYKRSKVINFRSIGHITSATKGFIDAYCCVSGNDTGTVTDNSFAPTNALAFAKSNTRAEEAEDTFVMHPNAQEFVIREDGVYEVRAAVSFVANATGLRGIKLTYDGNDIGNTIKVVPAVATFETKVETGCVQRMVAGKSVYAIGFQNSGGDLAYNRVNGIMMIKKISD